MSFFLPEVPSFAAQLSRDLGAGLSSGMTQSLEHARRLELEQQKSRTLAQQTKQLEKIKTMETGLGTIERMRELKSSAGGWTSDPAKKIQSLVPNSDVQRDRAELEALGRSLIPLVAAGVPIRNQREFDEYRKIITDPNSSPAQFEGALNGIQNILERSLEDGGPSPQKKAPENKEKKSAKMKFSASNPEHKKKAQQLFNTYKDKEKVREILSKEFEF